MNLKSIELALLAGVCGAFAGTAQADPLSWNPSWGFSGFGTLGYVATSTDLGSFEPSGSSSVDKSGSLWPDSKLGLQLTGRANAVFSTTVQTIVQRNANNEVRPGVEWAFVKAQATPELAFRAGRMGLPFFMVSDYLNVNYSNLWLRPPVDVYGQVGFSHFDGADAIYQASLGDTTFTGQAFYGTTTVNQSVRLHSRHERGINLSAEFSNGITVRVGRTNASLTADSADLDGLVALLDGSPYASVGNQLSVVGKHATFTGASVSIDHDNVVGSFEYTKRRTSSYISNTTGWAITGGYRLGKFTPFMVVSRLTVDNANVDNTIPASDPDFAPIGAVVDGLVASENVGEKTASLGLRWDAWKNVAVKAQVDRITTNGGQGQFLATKPGFGASPINVYSVSVDFVF